MTVRSMALALSCLSCACPSDDAGDSATSADSTPPTGDATAGTDPACMSSAGTVVCGSPCSSCEAASCICDGLGACVEDGFATCEIDFGSCITGDAGIPQDCGVPCSANCSSGACVCDGAGECRDEAMVTCSDTTSAGTGTGPGSGTSTGASSTGG